jgi:CheY-like chemotaxis protein
MDQDLMGENEVVLLIEDEPEVLDVTRRSIKGLGYQVVTAMNGEEALSAWEDDSQIDVVITDIVLPGGMSGFDIAQELTNRDADIKILFVSGYTPENLTLREDYRDVEILQKPFRRADLAQKLKTLLRS